MADFLDEKRREIDARMRELRPLVEEHDEDIGGRLSFKAINPKFLLKYDE